MPAELQNEAPACRQPPPGHAPGPRPRPPGVPPASRDLSHPPRASAFTPSQDCQQNRRPYQEDSWRAQLQLLPETHAFAVLDGHGGSAVSGYAAQHLHLRLRDALLQRLAASGSARALDVSPAAVASTPCEMPPQDLQACIEQAFAEVDSELRDAEGAHLVGSTGLMALVQPTCIAAAWAGECSPSPGIITFSNAPAAGQRVTLGMVCEGHRVSLRMGRPHQTPCSGAARTRGTLPGNCITALRPARR